MFSRFLRSAFVRSPMVHSQFKSLAAIRTHTDKCYERGDCFEVDNNREFDRLVKECGKPVVVTFYANWCQNCDCMRVSVVEKIVDKKEGAIRLAKVNVDKSTDLAVQYMIKGLPQILVFVNGEEVCKRLVGLQNPSRIEEVVDKAIEMYKNSTEKQ